jgi:hypothetical protein
VFDGGIFHVTPFVTLTTSLDKELSRLEKELSKLRAFLGENSVASKRQDGRRSDLKRREDSACAWIEQEKEFASWAKNVNDETNILHLRGSAGSGKSVTTAYVADHAWLSSTQDGRSKLVCKYFCRDDNQANDGITIFKSLLGQILAVRPDLSKFVLSKLPDIETSFASDNSQDDAWKILTDTLGRLGNSSTTYIVIDGLDECNTQSRHQLVGFLRDVCDTTDFVRIFLSSRYYDLSLELGSYMRNIDQRTDRERDIQIIRYQLATTRSKLAFPDELVEYAVQEIAEQTNGIVIWSHMAIEYLRTKKAITKEEINEHLKLLPESMIGVYCRHFEAARETFGKPSGVLLSDCLEVMVAALRPLTLEELTWAVWLKPSSTGKRRAVTVETFEKNRNKLSGADLLAPLRAFLLLPDINSGQDGRPLQLVHQSLKETILQLSPARWDPEAFPDVRVVDEECKARRRAMNQTMLDLCVDYLMRDDIKDIRNDPSYLEDAELRALDYYDFGKPKEPRTKKEWTPKIDHSRNGGTKKESHNTPSSTKADHSGNGTATRKSKKNTSASEAGNSAKETILDTNDVKLASLPGAQDQEINPIPNEMDTEVPYAPEDYDGTALAAFERRNPHLGGFFSYVACHWYLHLQQSDSSSSITFDDLVGLLATGSVRAANWIERASIEPISDIRGLPQDTLSLSVWYGGFVHFDRIVDAKRDAIVAELEDVGFKSAEEFQDALDKVIERAINNLDLQVLAKLAEKGQMSTYASSFGMMSKSWLKLATAEQKAKWIEIADFLFHNLAANMSGVMSGRMAKNAEECPCGYVQQILFEIICTAAENGCLPMVERLVAFHKERSPTKSSLPQRPVRPDKPNSMTEAPNVESSDSADFGPLGYAAWNGHADVVLYLLQLDGIDSHLKYHRELGSNILHFLVARVGSVKPAIIEALVESYPEAVNEVNPNTPVQDLVTNYPSDNPNVTEVLEHLITKGGADLRCGVPDINLLEYAAKYDKEHTCKCLISDGGLDPWDVIEFSKTGEVTLKVRIGDNGDPVKEKALAEKIYALSLTTSKAAPSK